MNSLKHYFLYYFLFLTQVSFAQEQSSADYIYSIQHYNVENGLSHNTIHNLAIDQNDNVLVLTRSGLDMISFGKCTNIQKIFPDYIGTQTHIISKAPGTYWLFNPGNFMEIDQGQFTHYDLKKVSFPNPHLNIKKNNISPINSTASNELYIINNNNQLLQIHTKDSIEIIANNLNLNINQDKPATLYSNNNDIHLVSFSNSRITNIKTINREQRKIIPTPDTTILKEQIFPIPSWTRRSKNLQTHPSIVEFIHNELDLRASHPLSIRKTDYDSASGLFWYLENYVLIGFHPTKGAIHKIPIPEFAITHYQIRFTKGSVWLSTTYDGIYQVSITEKKFKILETRKGNQRNILKDRQKQLWFANDNIHVFDTSYTPLKTFKITNHLAFLDRSGFIWTASIENDTLYKFNDSLQLIAAIPIDLELVDIKRIRIMIQDDNGTVWIPGAEKLLGIQKNLEKQEIHFNSTIPYPTFHMEQEGAEHIWFCTQNGLYLLHRPSGQLQLFSANQEGENFIPALTFNHMYIDSDSIYWLATSDAGLIRWDRKKNLQTTQDPVTKIYDTNFGMPSNIMHAIYEDNNGFLWISSEYGLIQFHKQSEHFQYFLEEEGIMNNEFNRCAHFRDQDGNIYYGGVKGITIFHPDDFTIDTTLSPISIFSLQKLENKRYSDYLNQYTSIGKIKFETPYDLFILKFDNNNSNFRDAYRYFYTYDEQDWIPTNSNSISINNLSPGDHRLHLKKENLAGDIIGQLSIPIKVPKPFYLAYWFFSLIILSLIGLIYLLLKIKTRNYRTRQAKLEKLVHERTQKIEQDKILIEHQAKILKHLHDKKSTLFKNIAHELRNPLTLIFGATKMLEKKLSQITDKKGDKKYINAITSSGDKILSLADEVLFLAKLETNTEQLHLAPISFFLLFEKIIKHFNVIADFQQKELDFNYELPKDLVLQLDAVKTEKVITNLLSNAFKFSPKGTKIYLDISNQQNQLIVSVKDSGYGISEEELPFIFEPYYRSERTTEIYDGLEGTGGTGIGLSITKKLVDLLGGHIEVQSEINKGTTFTFSLPISIVSQEQQAMIIQPQDNVIVDPAFSKALPIKKNHHILIVDDHPGVINFIKDLLESNYIISVASNGKSALEVIEENNKTKNIVPISLLICDIMMPDMDGIQLVESLKKHTKWKQLPVIFLTGYNDEVTKKRALRIGIEDYLIKPFNPDELLSRISHLLNTKEKPASSERLEDTFGNTSFDAEWINQFNQLVQNNIENLNLDVDFLANEMAIGKRQLTRKIKQHTGLTPGKYVQEVRLQKARLLLEDKTHYSVSAVAYSVGFKSPKYFSKQFRARFGRLPSSYYK